MPANIGNLRQANERQLHVMTGRIIKGWTFEPMPSLSECNIGNRACNTHTIEPSHPITWVRVQS